MRECGKTPTDTENLILISAIQRPRSGGLCAVSKARKIQRMDPVCQSLTCAVLMLPMCETVPLSSIGREKSYWYELMFHRLSSCHGRGVVQDASSSQQGQRKLFKYQFANRNNKLNILFTSSCICALFAFRNMIQISSQVSSDDRFRQGSDEPRP